MNAISYDEAATIRQLTLTDGKGYVEIRINKERSVAAGVREQLRPGDIVKLDRIVRVEPTADGVPGSSEIMYVCIKLASLCVYVLAKYRCFSF